MNNPWVFNFQSYHRYKGGWHEFHYNVKSLAFDRGGDSKARDEGVLYLLVADPLACLD